MKLDKMILVYQKSMEGESQGTSSQLGLQMSCVTAHLESQLGKGPRQHVSSVGESSKIAALVPFIIPGLLQIDVIINL